MALMNQYTLNPWSIRIILDYLKKGMVIRNDLILGSSYIMTIDQVEVKMIPTSELVSLLHHNLVVQKERIRCFDSMFKEYFEITDKGRAWKPFEI